MDNDKTLEKIRESVEEAIKPILKKGESMTPADLESLTKAVCIIEKIKRIESDDFNDDYSYERGRSPITGRYVSRDAYHDGASTRRYYDGKSNNGYSGHSIQDRMIDRLERMMDEAQSENERQTVRDWIHRLRS